MISKFFAAAWLCGLALFATLPVMAHAGLDEAVQNFKKVLPKLSVGAQFDESPFEGWYMRVGSGNEMVLFTENMEYFGYGSDWYTRQAGKLSEVTEAREIKNLRQKMLAALKTDWLPDGGFGQGATRVVIVSAPNCPICKLQDRDLERYATDLGINVRIVPQFLDLEQKQANKQFIDAVMCGTDPSAAWVTSRKHRGTLPPPVASCKHSRWVTAVLSHSFANASGKVLVKTPAVIHSDGTVTTGWGAKTKAQAKAALGVSKSSEQKPKESQLYELQVVVEQSH